MQPLKITVPGRYWDSQIYRGKLYLFDREGALITLDWDGLIDDLKVDPESSLALKCAFTSSDLLYDPRVAEILGDSELRPIMRSKFDRLAHEPLEIRPDLFQKRTIKRQVNPFPFPHADSTIYWNRLYVGGSSGVWSATCAKASGNPVSSRPQKNWDASVFAVAGLYGELACAAGDDGLFQIPLQEHREPESVSRRNCVDCQWAYQSIYGSSHVGHGFLAEYSKSRDAHANFTRTLERIIDDVEIFQDDGYSWGTQDKLCQAAGGRVHIVNYDPASSDAPQRPRRQHTVFLDAWKGEVVSGKLAVYGAIIECDAAIVIALSDETTVTIRGEPINWRVFPKSIRYENHLHVVYEDHLLVASFNQDYFVDQGMKRFGIKYYPADLRRSASRERTAPVARITNLCEGPGTAIDIDDVLDSE